MSLSGLSRLLLVIILNGELTELLATEATPAASKSRLENGLWELTSKSIRIVTDIDPDDSIAELPIVFDHAVKEWFRQIGKDVDPAIAKVDAYLMLDRERFRQLDLLPPDSAQFRHGFQRNNEIFISEQPSPYYRRHLLLHEGFHWFLNQIVHIEGRPCLIEGLCEQAGTHRWQNDTLEMGIFPATTEEVPYWGRVKMIRDDRVNGSAPSLIEVVEYSATAHLLDPPYAWSWAAVQFFSHHPRYRDDFSSIVWNPDSSAATRNAQWKELIRQSSPDVLAEWELYVAELDYGFDANASLVDLSAPPKRTRERGEIASIIRVESNRGWQNIGMDVKAGECWTYSTESRIVVNSTELQPNEFAWESEADGITLRYVNGHPLGCLVACVIPASSLTFETTTPSFPILRLGKSGELKSPVDGKLLLRVNEPSRGLHDNRGSFEMHLLRADR